MIILCVALCALNCFKASAVVLYLRLGFEFFHYIKEIIVDLRLISELQLNLQIEIKYLNIVKDLKNTPY